MDKVFQIGVVELMLIVAITLVVSCVITAFVVTLNQNKFPIGNKGKQTANRLRPVYDKLNIQPGRRI